ncbi:hypothetical protein Tco_1069160 [Tanacetum coccineum]|uniref:Uncharacterized protein n=1 Tax=Tanacetum coccineum TaxID=301880 RepID=A0ABQ5HJY0_9ASTR
MSTRIAEATALSPSSFVREDTEDESSDSDTEREGLEDEGPGLEEEEEATLEGQQQAIPVVDTAANEPLGLGYGALRRQHLRVEETPAPRPPVHAT